MLVHNNGIYMIHSGISTLYICILSHTPAPPTLTRRHTHTHTRFLSCHYLLCSTKPRRKMANHRACMDQLKAMRAALNKLAVLLKVFSQATFFPPPGSCHVDLKISTTPNMACQHLFRKPVCRLLLDTHCTHSFSFCSNYFL